MNPNTTKLIKSQHAQQGVSLVVALVMLLVLTLIGVSSMNTAIVELKMANSMQQQTIALNNADELLIEGEQNVETLVASAIADDFAAAGDGLYVTADNIDVHNLDWNGQGLQSIPGANGQYVIEYLGPKQIPGESIVTGTDGRIIGGAVHTFRITSRSTTGRNALRLVQSIYVTLTPP